MTSYPKLGSLLIIFGLGASCNSAGFTPEYFHNQAETMREDAKEWTVGHLAEYLSKPIFLFCFLAIGWPMAKRIWRRTYKSGRIAPANSSDSRSNATTSGVPAEVCDDELILPKRKSVFVKKLHSPVDILNPRCANELVRLTPNREVWWIHCSSPLRKICERLPTLGNV